MIQDIELKWIERAEAIDYLPGIGKVVRVLQWRKLFNDCSLGIYWTDWQDVPLTEET
jgi:hypothetical protein